MNISMKTSWPGREIKEDFCDIKSLVSRLNGFESERNSGCPNTVVLYLDGRKIATIPGMDIGKFSEFVSMVVDWEVIYE